MSGNNSILKSLMEYRDSCLVLIDIQQVFLDKLAECEVDPLIQRIVWLVRAADKLGVPIVATAEDIEKNGSVISPLADVLPSGIKIHNKMIFNLADDPDILRSIADTGRKTAVLLGLETDVCVAQSALGLQRNGYSVAVVEDATAAPGKAHQYGISRMQSAGILVSNVKSLFYEWIRNLKECRDFFNGGETSVGDPGIVM